MQPLVRRATLALAVLGLFATVAISTSELRGAGRGGPATPTDELLVYQNGFCQVFRTLEVKVVDGEVVLDLPAGTLIDTLRIEGIEIIEIVARDATRPFLPGDRVLITIGSERLEGRILSIADRFVLETANGTRHLDPAAIRSIEVLDASAPLAGQMQVRIRVADADGPRKITTNYLLRGLSWHASHELDVQTGKMRTWATISGSPGLAVEQLSLVSGSPRLVMSSPRGSMEFASMRLTDASAGAASNDWSPSSLDEYHEYTLGRPIELPVGRDLRIALFLNHVDLSHELAGNTGTYGGTITVEHRWSFTNPSKEPLPAGPVSFYRDGRFIGQDHMRYLPRAEKVTLVSGDALDIKASATSDCIASNQDRIEITVTNRKSEQATVRIEMSVDRTQKVMSTAPEPVKAKHSLEWIFTLAPDGTAHATAVVARPYGQTCTPMEDWVA